MTSVFPSKTYAALWTGIVLTLAVSVGSVVVTHAQVAPPHACTLPAPQGYTVKNGTAGNDTVYLTRNTMFFGNGGNDRVLGTTGNHILCFGNGSDRVTLGRGNVEIDGGGGNNTITLGSGVGTIITGAGNDKRAAGKRGKIVAEVVLLIAANHDISATAHRAKPAV